jgi:hypothetical protein
LVRQLTRLLFQFLVLLPQVSVLVFQKSSFFKGGLGLRSRLSNPFWQATTPFERKARIVFIKSSALKPSKECSKSANKKQ